MLICQAAANKTCYRSFQSFFQFLQTKQVKRLFTTGKVFSFDKKRDILCRTSESNNESLGNCKQSPLGIQSESECWVQFPRLKCTSATSRIVTPHICQSTWNCFSCKTKQPQRCIHRSVNLESYRIEPSTTTHTPCSSVSPLKHEFTGNLCHLYLKRQRRATLPSQQKRQTTTVYLKLSTSLKTL
jgi:hypothetical protein